MPTQMSLESTITRRERQRDLIPMSKTEREDSERFIKLKVYSE